MRTDTDIMKEISFWEETKRYWAKNTEYMGISNMQNFFIENANKKLKQLHREMTEYLARHEDYNKKKTEKQYRNSIDDEDLIEDEKN